MWLAYVLLCRDIELACDEKVIKELGNEQRADYTQALVACSVNRRMIAACPLAFGEVGVKERVKSVMNYKKPAFWRNYLCLVVAESNIWIYRKFYSWFIIHSRGVLCVVKPLYDGIYLISNTHLYIFHFTLRNLLAKQFWLMVCQYGTLILLTLLGMISQKSVQHTALVLEWLIIALPFMTM